MFYLLRHGETEWNRLGLLQGHRDSPLTPRGIAQAEAMAALVLRLAGDACGIALWSSPLGRARATAEVVAARLGRAAAEVRTDPRLTELAYGDWEGRSPTEIARDDRAAWELRYRDKFRNPIPGGECYRDAWRRARAFLGEHAGDAIVVGHGAFNRMFVAAACGRDPESCLDLPDAQDLIYVIEGDGWRIEATGMAPD